MASITRDLDPSVLKRAGVQLAFIGNGAFELIPYYRGEISVVIMYGQRKDSLSAAAIFKTPFHLYTDPTHSVYRALGMTRQSLEPGPPEGYVRHGLISGIGMVVGNAVRVRMPLFKEKGNIKQLGGEFVLGPG
jgi:hypothetical protein